MPGAKKTAAETIEIGTADGSSTFLSRMGLFGLARLEPVILAALVTEEPLLLIGTHGTGKSLLLTRIAETLELEFRHYNASLLNFDDLIGFPLPSKDGTLEYVKTPAAIWGAEAVIFDEISRCRPDIQNKLFPIVHERKAQGVPLEGLRFRWAAMNPPMMEDDDHGYLGSEPLDAALADRFAFVAEMPSWESLSEADQLAIIGAASEPAEPGAAPALRSAIATAVAALPGLRETMGQAVAIYVRTLVALLSQADIVLSPRRAGMLLRTIIAVHASALAIDPAANASDSTLVAVRNGLPQRAQGIAISETKILAAHKAAWRVAGVRPGDPLGAILATADMIERVRLAVAAPKLPKGQFSGIIADAMAQLGPGAREAVVVHVFETGAVGRLNAAVAEQAGEIYRDVATPLNFSEMQHAHSSRFETWKCIKNILSRLDPRDPRARLAANALAACYARELLARPEDADAAYQAWTETDGRLSGALA
jgi:MoxR-like ATPase